PPVRNPRRAGGGPPGPHGPRRRPRHHHHQRVRSGPDGGADGRSTDRPGRAGHPPHRVRPGRQRMSTGSALLVALVLLILNAFFVGAEFALTSARRSQIEPRADAGSRPARITLRAMERVVLMMTCAQLGITACSLGLGAVGEPAVAALIEGPL